MSYEPRHEKKPVFGVCDKVRFKPVCLATETSYSFEISYIASRGIILSRQRTTKALIRADAQADLCLCYSHRVKTGFLMTRLI